MHELEYHNFIFFHKNLITVGFFLLGYYKKSAILLLKNLFGFCSGKAYIKNTTLDVKIPVKIEKKKAEMPSEGRRERTDIDSGRVTE